MSGIITAGALAPVNSKLKVHEEATVDFTLAAGTGYTTGSIPITGTYNAAQHFPRILVRSSSYAAAGTYMREITWWQDFANNQIDMFFYQATGSADVKLRYQICSIPGMRVQQGRTLSSAFTASATPNATATLTLPRAVANTSRYYFHINSTGELYNVDGTAFFSGIHYLSNTSTITLDGWSSSGAAVYVPYVIGD